MQIFDSQEVQSSQNMNDNFTPETEEQKVMRQINESEIGQKLAHLKTDIRPKPAPPHNKRELHLIASDMQSFDILWFDLVTKTRSLIQELCEPMIERVHQQRDIILQLTKSN